MKQTRDALLLDLLRNGPSPEKAHDADELAVLTEMESAGLIESAVQLTPEGRVAALALQDEASLIESRPDLGRK